MDSAISPSSYGRRRKFTDSDLRSDLDSGLTLTEIAEKRGVTHEAVRQRAHKLNAGTVSEAVAPFEARRHVSTTIDAMEQLTRSLAKVNLLMDACDEWLRDAEDPEKYDIGARTEEVMVTYYEMLLGPGGEPVRKKNRKPLSELLKIVEKVFEVEHSEIKRADPRELILKTAQETRATVQTATELANAILNVRAMMAFRQAILDEIRKVSPDVAGRIAEAVRHSILLHAALGGPAGVAAD